MSKIIWTNHAIQRIHDRKIPQSQIEQTIYSPDSKINNNDSSIESLRQFGHQKVHVITRENEKGEIIILSCWINPPNHGSQDYKKEKYYKENKKASGLKRFWLTFKNQIGF
jgi:hypothetical protein